MIELLLGFFTAFSVVLLATPSLIKVAKLKHLVDVPGEARKLHRRSVPTIGGIIIFAATIFSYALWFPSEHTVFFGSVFSFSVSVKEFKFIVAATILLFFTGVKDDIIGVAPVKKLISHVMVGFILVLMADVRILGMYGIFEIYELPYWASVLLSVFTYIVVVNAFNLIDGVDGLAAGIGLICSVLFGIWFALSDQMSLALLSFVLTGSLGAFLVYNFSPARIFMGDSGSLFIGALMYFLAVKCIGTSTWKMPDFLQGISAPVFAMSVLAYPLTDTLRVFIYRAVKGISPFSADNNHIHHKLLEKGYNHRKTSIILYMTSLVVAIIAIPVGKVNPSIGFVVMLLIAQLAFNFIIIRKKNTPTVSV